MLSIPQEAVSFTRIAKQPLNINEIMLNPLIKLGSIIILICLFHSCIATTRITQNIPWPEGSHSGYSSSTWTKEKGWHRPYIKPTNTHTLVLSMATDTWRAIMPDKDRKKVNVSFIQITDDPLGTILLSDDFQLVTTFLDPHIKKFNKKVIVINLYEVACKHPEYKSSYNEWLHSQKNARHLRQTREYQYNSKTKTYQFQTAKNYIGPDLKGR